MTLKEIQQKLTALADKGYVLTRRKGATGIGYTLEHEMQVNENNLAIPDIGGRVELKATRRKASALVTLFTYNRAAWQFKQKQIIEKFGYIDENEREALYSTVFAKNANTLGLILKIEKDENKINLVHKQSNTLLASWSIYTIVGKFITKLERLIVVFADNRQNKKYDKEEFHFNEAVLLEEPSPEKFLEAFDNSDIAIDVRMHLNAKGSVRNHGTGFRIREEKIPLLYGKKKKIL